MKIGTDFDNNNYFEGLIDNVMIFDRALSGDEVQALAEAGNDNVLSVAATTHDKAGNLTVDYRGYQYSYDYENRLIEIADNDDTSIVEYAYDALGRRIQKDDKIAGAKTRYYNNHDWQVLAEYNDSGVHQRSYIYGGYIDEVLVMVDPIAAEDYYYAHNHLYSPTALLDDAGDIIERYEYDAYGRPYFMEPNFVLYETQKSNYGNTVLFTGRTVDILDNGSLILQYSRNRYYDYHTGRWLTKDPQGNVDGLNLYQYVESNPVILLDPDGRHYLHPSNPYWPDDPPEPEEYCLYIDGELDTVAGDRVNDPLRPPLWDPEGAMDIAELYEGKYFDDMVDIYGTDPYGGGYRHCVAACLLVRTYGPWIGGCMVNYWDNKHEYLWDDDMREMINIEDMLAEQVGVDIGEDYDLPCHIGCLEVFKNVLFYGFH